MAKEINPFVITRKIKPHILAIGERVGMIGRILANTNNMVITSPQHIVKGLIRFCIK